VFSVELHGEAATELEALPGLIAAKMVRLLEAYEAELRKERLQELLAEWRRHAGLNSADVAARMEIAPSTLSRMEKNITSASFENLSKYARACGVEMATLFFSNKPAAFFTYYKALTKHASV